jgi:hypothetical protein
MLKPGSIGKPSQYLRSKVGEYCLSDDPDKVRWYCSLDKYVKEAARNVSNWMESRDKTLRQKVQTVYRLGTDRN